MGRRSGTVVLALLLALTGCSAGSGEKSAAASESPSATSSSASATASVSASGTKALPTSTGGLPRPDHVMVVIFENKKANAVLGSPDAPYLTQLAATGATLTDAHGVTHPSEPNYLALFSGSTYDVRDDACPLSLDGPTLAGQLADSGRTFTGYAEGLPAPGSPACTAGRYARKHAPWADFPALSPDVGQPFTALPADWAGLPTVSFVVPDLCNDMHDCGVAAGDAWARAALPRYVDTAAAANAVVVVTFDEDDGSSDNHIPMFVVGAGVRPGPSKQRVDHYSLLRTIEDMYALSPIGLAGKAEPITGIWATG
jgi:acid phosphatase